MRAKARMDKPEIPAAEVLNRENEQMDKRDADEALPVFDLEAMFDEVENAFEQGFNLDEQLNALTSMAPAPAKKPPIKDDVFAAPLPSTATENSRSRTSGVPIPISSLKASRKTDEARAKSASANQVPASRFQPAKMPPPPNTAAAKPPPLRVSASNPVAKPAPPPAPPKRDISTGRAQGGQGLDDNKIQSVYRAYVAARKQTNERTDNISLQKISDVLKQTDKAKGGVSDFKVVIKNGKAVIKAVK